MKTRRVRHTPGYWEWHGDRLVADDNFFVIEDSGDSTDADRNLISASPDLLEACKALMDECPVWTKGCELAEKALKKARGELR